MGKKEASEKEPRRTMGKHMDQALFPVSPTKRELPIDYADTLASLKKQIERRRLQIVFKANADLVMLYWDIGNIILEKQERAGWGAKIIDRLSHDLRTSFPDIKGFSPRNLKYMRKFASSWPEREFVQELLAQLPWYHNLALLEKSDDRAARIWYARKTIEHGWSRNVLALHMESELHTRQGKAITNFTKTLPSTDSDMAVQVFKDPYLFDFLGTADQRTEREVEKALVDNIQRFLLELGSGFAFVGRQVHLEVGGQDFWLDLLFYHLKLRCFVVIELKAVPFDAAFSGKLNLYLSAVDDLLRHHDDKPTIGLILCRNKDELVVEYALRDINKPIGVANWETRIVKSLPRELRGSLPSIEEIEAELSDKEKTASESKEKET